MRVTRTTRWQVVGASTIGTIVEWYDFYLYGTAAALVLNQVFFPNLDPLAGILASYASFAAGFLVRPFGGVIFGHFGDKYGRKPILIATLLLMGFATAGIGLLPTYNSIGIAAPILLLLLRMLQGLGAGAEYSGAILFSAEYNSDRRGFFASWPPAASDFAVALSAGVFALFKLMPDDQFLAWGWRIPFLLSLLAVAVGYFVRRRILETPEFTAVKEEARQTRVPALELITKHPRRVLVAMGVNVGPSVGYVFTVFALGYMTKQLGVPQGTALLAAGDRCLVRRRRQHPVRKPVGPHRPPQHHVVGFAVLRRLCVPVLLAAGDAPAAAHHVRDGRGVLDWPALCVRGAARFLHRAVRDTASLLRHRAGAGDDGGAGRRPASARRHGRGRRGGRGVVAGRRADDRAGTDYHPVRGHGAGAGRRHSAGGEGIDSLEPYPRRV